MSDPLFVVVLPSGRMAKIAEPTLESTWEVAEQAGARTGGSFNVSRHSIEVDKELVRVHLRAITRGPVPWQFVDDDKAERLDAAPVPASLLVDFGNVLAAADNMGELYRKMASLLASVKPPVADDVDFDAMAAAARDGAGGGYLPLTYKDLVSSGDLSLLGLFNKSRSDFQSLVAQINRLSEGAPDPKAPPAVTLLGRRVIEVSA